MIRSLFTIFTIFRCCSTWKLWKLRSIFPVLPIFPISPLFLFLAFLAVTTSCSRSHHGYDVCGAEDFVTDSYCIKQGKLAILEMEGQEVTELPDDAMKEYVDVVAEDDILNIQIYHPTRKDLVQSIHTINVGVGFRVRNGMVNIPDLPPVEVGGLTLDDARDKLEEEFRTQIHDIEVFISYRDRLSRKIDLTGIAELTTLPVDGKIRLYEVLSKARISPKANLFKSYVMRDGKPLAIDLYQLMGKGDLSYNIVMKGGDKIFVAPPEDATVMVMGEVFRAHAVPIPYGFISLRQAIVAAGGIPFTGDRRHIQVIRGNLLQPKIYVLAWEHIIHLPNDSLLLMPGDTVYISEKPITQWNRFISQLLPSATALQTGYTTYKIVSK